MREEIRFVAFDGTPWDSKEACQAHEAKHPELALVGLSADAIREALSRVNIELADAIEAVAARIARKRRADGTLRRQPAAKVAPPAGAAGGQALPPGTFQGGGGSVPAPGGIGSGGKAP